MFDQIVFWALNVLYVYLVTYTNKCTYLYYLRNLKSTLKHLKRSYMFRSYDNFSEEQCMLPEDDYMIETCRIVLSVLM